jgi:translocator protein
LNTFIRNFSSIAICESVGFLSGLVVSPDTWYSTLKKPSITPPSWIFGPVWTILYALMGISAAMVIVKKNRDATVGMGFFSAQLILNFLWSIIFFGVHLPLAAFIDILLLLTMILLTFWKFSRVSKPAAVLLIPYILWVSFASVLNLKLWRLNRL